jgi:hypothetical protein
MVSLAPPILPEGIEVLKTSLWCNELLASFKPLSSKPESKHGFSPSGSVADEVHAWEPVRTSKWWWKARAPAPSRSTS